MVAMVVRKFFNVLFVSVILCMLIFFKVCINKILGLVLCCVVFWCFLLFLLLMIILLSLRLVMRSSCNSFGNSLSGNDFDLEMWMCVLRSLLCMVFIVSVMFVWYVLNIFYGILMYVIWVICVFSVVKIFW